MGEPPRTAMLGGLGSQRRERNLDLWLPKSKKVRALAPVLGEGPAIPACPERFAVRKA